MKELFSLGELYVSDFLRDGESPRHPPVEMKLMLDEEYGVARLEKSAPLNTMYADKYWYRSGINWTMKQELSDIVDSITKIKPLKTGNLWVDIACFPAGNFINTTNGNIDIKNIKVGDRVLSHDGIYHKVIRLYNKKYNGNFVTLKLRGLNTNTIMTNNHPILTERGWIEAKDLSLNDKISLRSDIYQSVGNCINLYDILKLSHKHDIIKNEDGWIISKSNGIKTSVPEKIKLNNDLMKVFGYYIGEGSGCGGTGIQFAFSLGEMEKAQDIKKYFIKIFHNNPEIIVKPDKGIITVRIHSSLVSSVFKYLFGHTAKNKKIPQIILQDRLIPSFLNALWFTDGHFTWYTKKNKKPRKKYVYSSISKNLILDIWNLLESFDIICSVQSVKNDRGFSVEGGSIYRLTVERIKSVENLEKMFSNNKCSKLESQERFVEILNIESTIEEHEVYNFEVEESNSYVCNGVTVHNCNDGTLLSFLKEDIIKIGIDPVDDSYKRESELHADLIIQDYFSAKVFKKSKYGNLKADVVTTIAMFYDLEEPVPFINDVKEILADDGVWVLQMSYTPLMLEQLAFDNICHEHMYYYSLFNIKQILNDCGMEVVDVHLNDINGGSFRIWVMKTESVNNFGSQPHRDVCNFRVESLLNYELNLDLDYEYTWEVFYDKINELKQQTVSFIKDVKAQGKSVWAYGACHDMQTRIITEKGIKWFHELLIDDKIYSLNLDTQEVELSNIDEKFIFPYSGELIHLFGKRVDQMITPNHNVLFQTEQISKFQLETAEEVIKRKSFKLPMGKWIGTNSNNKFNINKFVDQTYYSNKCRKIQEEFDTKDFMYLLGIFLGDGYAINQDGGYSINLCIPKNDKARNKLKETLNKMNLLFREYDNEIQVASQALYNIMLQCNQGALNKSIPSWALEYSPEYLNCILDGLVDSDGWYEVNHRRKFCSSSFVLIKDVIELCFKVGLYPSITTRKELIEKPKIKGREINAEKAYIVNICTTQPRCYNNERVQYSGDIWCVSTKNKNFLVERNGKISFSGNSTKGNTLLQYFGLDNTLIDGIAERSPYKYGLRTVGTNIPIVSEEEMRKANPDYLLVLPWHFINEFVKRESEYLNNGGKFIVPCPKFEIIGAKAE